MRCIDGIGGKAARCVDDIGDHSVRCYRREGTAKCRRYRREGSAMYRRYIREGRAGRYKRETRCACTTKMSPTYDALGPQSPGLVMASNTLSL